MAGILAVSASASMSAGDTSVDNARGGYVSNERITLTTNPTGTNYVWALGGPSNTNLARSALSAETGSTVSFTPDVSGYFVVTCTVDGVTTYILRISVESTAISQLVDAIRFSPKADASVPAPALGVTMYFSSDQDALVVKDPAGDIFPVELGAAV